MEFELPAPKSQEPLKLRTGRIAGAIGITLCAAVVVVALCVGAFRLGVESASAAIYERQVAKAEAKADAQRSDFLAIVGIVDQAKARELASCNETGRSDCVSVIAAVVSQ